LQLRLTSQAARDLREIVAYIGRDNPVAAERFGLALVEKAELLKKFPLLGKKVQGTENDRVLVEYPTASWKWGSTSPTMNRPGRPSFTTAGRTKFGSIRSSGLRSKNALHRYA
jgi:ParE toxin of type II toxin-antitoxin system, parDE